MPEFIAGGISGSEAGIAGGAIGAGAIGAGLGLGAAFLTTGFGAAGIAFFLGAAFLTAFFAFAATFFFAFIGRDFFFAALFFADVRVAELRLAFTTARFDLRFFDLLFFAMITLLLNIVRTRCESSPEKVCCHLCVNAGVVRMDCVGCFGVINRTHSPAERCLAKTPAGVS
jgi:hypothetical protein